MSVRQAVMERSWNVAIRMASTGSRFVLLLALAKMLPPADVGRYGLFLSSVVLGVALLGLEFYAYSTRELVREAPARWSFVIQHSAVAWLLAYATILPALWLTANWWSVPGIAIFWLPAVMLVEHLCQETNRLIVAMKRPLAASALTFIRMAAWVWVILPLFWLQPQHRSLELVFAAWFVGALTAFLASTLVIRAAVGEWRRWPVSWAWLARGASVGLLYLGASVAFRGIFAADRYLVQYLLGPDDLGVYVFYIGMATAIITVIESAVLAFLQPRLVEAWHTGDRSSYETIYRELRWSILAISSSLVLLIGWAAPIVAQWIGRPVYAGNQTLLWLLLAMAWVYANGLALDCALYARGKDRTLTIAMVSTFVVFVIGALVIAWFDRKHAVACGLLFSFAIIFVAKQRLLSRDDFRR